MLSITPYFLSVFSHLVDRFWETVASRQISRLGVHNEMNSIAVSRWGISQTRHLRDTRETDEVKLGILSLLSLEFKDAALVMVTTEAKVNPLFGLRIGILVPHKLWRTAVTCCILERNGSLPAWNDRCPFVWVISLKKMYVSRINWNKWKAIKQPPTNNELLNCVRTTRQRITRAKNQEVRCRNVCKEFLKKKVLSNGSVRAIVRMDA